MKRKLEIFNIDKSKKPKNEIFILNLQLWYFDIIRICQSIQSKNISVDNMILEIKLPKLFIKRVETNSFWSLFDPLDCQNLIYCSNEEFDKLYIELENNRKYVKQIEAQKLWFDLMDCYSENLWISLSYR